MLHKLATIDDLYRVKEKAELVDGEIVIMPPCGDMPGFAGDEIYSSLRLYARATGVGTAYSDGKGFLCDLPHRQSFSPDAAYYTGPHSGMRFLPQPPVFAVEVRSEDDYGPRAEEAMEQKRADYFASGTLVVWDVDLQSADVVRVYRATSPEVPTIYRLGDQAEAEPAVPGWRMAVDDVVRGP